MRRPRLGSMRVGLAPEGHEGLLDDVLGVGAVPEDAVGEPEGAATEEVVELDHGLRVAQAKAASQGLYFLIGSS